MFYDTMFCSISQPYSSYTAMNLKGLIGSQDDWESLDDMKRIFSHRKTPMSGRCLFIPSYTKFTILHHCRCLCECFDFVFECVVLSEYVADHWMDEDFYGYQFLNGVNPNTITKCTTLPENFPVTEEMVKPFLEGSSLQEQMEVGKTRGSTLCTSTNASPWFW